MSSKALAIFIAVLAVGGCSTHQVTLTYKPAASIVTSNPGPAVSVGSFIDRRGETATWFGAIRGGYGNPLKKLEATPSVAALVHGAFSDGLSARGMLSSNPAGGYQISGVIKKLDCSQLVRREAHAEIDVSVFDVSTGNRVFSQTYEANKTEGSLFTVGAGVFGSVEALRALTEKALSDVVDKSLDDTTLRMSMRRMQPAAPVSAPAL